MDSRERGILIISLLILIIAGAFGIVIYGIANAKEIGGCKPHQIHMTKTPYVNGDRIITNHFDGGLVPPGRITDTVCPYEKYTAIFVSENGSIKSTFYPTGHEYEFNVDERGKPVFNGTLPNGTTTYTFKSANGKIESYHDVEECANIDGICNGELCELTITKWCESEY